MKSGKSKRNDSKMNVKKNRKKKQTKQTKRIKIKNEDKGDPVRRFEGRKKISQNFSNQIRNSFPNEHQNPIEPPFVSKHIELPWKKGNEISIKPGHRGRLWCYAPLIESEAAETLENPIELGFTEFYWVLPGFTGS